MPNYDTKDNPQQQTEDILAREAESSLCLNTLPYQIRYRISEFTGSEFQVWMAHLSHAHRKDRRTFPSIALLMRETGLSESGIKIARRGLVEKKWLMKYKTTDPKTRKRKSSTAYCKWPPPKPGSMYASMLERKEDI